MLVAYTIVFQVYLTREWFIISLLLIYSQFVQENEFDSFRRTCLPRHNQPFDDVFIRLFVTS